MIKISTYINLIINISASFFSSDGMKVYNDIIQYLIFYLIKFFFNFLYYNNKILFSFTRRSGQSCVSIFSFVKNVSWNIVAYKPIKNTIIRNIKNKEANNLDDTWPVDYHRSLYLPGCMSDVERKLSEKSWSCETHVSGKRQGKVRSEEKRKNSTKTGC